MEHETETGWTWSPWNLVHQGTNPDQRWQIRSSGAGGDSVWRSYIVLLRCLGTSLSEFSSRKSWTRLNFSSLIGLMEVCVLQVRLMLFMFGFDSKSVDLLCSETFALWMSLTISLITWIHCCSTTSRQTPINPVQRDSTFPLICLQNMIHLGCFWTFTVKYSNAQTRNCDSSTEMGAILCSLYLNR